MEKPLLLHWEIITKLQKHFHEIYKNFPPELLSRFYNIFNDNFAQMYSLIWTAFSGERCGPWTSCLLCSYHLPIEMAWSFILTSPKYRIDPVILEKIKMRKSYDDDNGQRTHFDQKPLSQVTYRHWIASDWIYYKNLLIYMRANLGTVFGGIILCRLIGGHV